MLGNLKNLLRAHGLTQAGLAAEIGLRQEAVSRWLNGHSKPSGENLMAVLEVLRRYDPSLTIDDLMKADAA